MFLIFFSNFHKKFLFSGSSIFFDNEYELRTAGTSFLSTRYECERGEVPMLKNARHRVGSWVDEEAVFPGTVVGYDCEEGFTMAPDNFEGKVCTEDRSFENVPRNVEGSCVKGNKNVVVV